MVKKKARLVPGEERLSWVEPNPTLSMRRQCELLGVNRAQAYYEPAGESRENLELMRLVDEQYMQTPFYGSRRMTEWLKRQAHCVNRKRVQRLMRLMGIEAIYPKPKLSASDKQHRKFPYLLRDLAIIRPNHVWCTDITYVPIRHGFLYLVVVMDWYSRYVLSWRLSNTMDVRFCLEALEEALTHGTPEIFNSDQGSQFTSRDFTDGLLSAGVRISMDGKGRAFDNIFIERLWRSYKYEDLYIKDYDDVRETVEGTSRYWQFYNNERPHQALGYLTPAEVHFSSIGRGVAA